VNGYVKENIWLLYRRKQFIGEEDFLHLIDSKIRLSSFPS
jgi:hypothetical protein